MQVRTGPIAPVLLKHSVAQFPVHGYFDSKQSRTALQLASSDVLLSLQVLHAGAVPQAYPLLMTLLMQLPPSGEGNNPASASGVPTAPVLVTPPLFTTPPEPVNVVPPVDKVPPLPPISTAAASNRLLAVPPVPVAPPTPPVAGASITIALLVPTSLVRAPSIPEIAPSTSPSGGPANWFAS
jgi:hypothetical protein